MLWETGRERRRGGHQRVRKEDSCEAVSQPSALAHGEAAFELADAIGSIHQQARVALALGETHYLMKDYQQALTRHGQSLELNRRAGYLVGQAETHYELGVTHRALGQPDDARDHLGRALGILRQLGAPEAAIVEAELAWLETPTEGRPTTSS